MSGDSAAPLAETAPIRQQQRSGPAPQRGKRFGNNNGNGNGNGGGNRSRGMRSAA